MRTAPNRSSGTPLETLHPFRLPLFALPIAVSVIEFARESDVGSVQTVCACLKLPSETILMNFLVCRHLSTSLLLRYLAESLG